MISDNLHRTIRGMQVAVVLLAITSICLAIAVIVLAAR